MGLAKKYHRDVWVGLVLFGFCMFALITAMKIPGEASYLPIALSVLMAICAACIVWKGLRLTKEQHGDYKYALTIKESRYAFLFMFFIFLYYLGFRYIAYWIATPVFMILTQKFLKLKSMKVNLLITVLYTVLCFITFVMILHLPIYKIGILGRLFRYV